MKPYVFFLFRCIGFLWNVFTDIILAFIDSRKSKQGYQADFGRETDIASRFNRGFVISRHRRLSRKRSYENLLIAGPTGSGKTTALLVKTIWELKNSSLVINDPSGELYALTSGYLAKHCKVKTLNFSDSSKSCGFNPLVRIAKKTDAHKVAEMLVAATMNKGSSDPFWNLQAQAVMTMFIQLLQHQAIQYRTMANLVDIVNCFAANPDAIDTIVAGTGDNSLISEYKTIVSFPEKTLLNIIASVKACLMLFSDGEVALVTSFDSLDFAEFREKPTVLFIHNSISDQRYFSTLNAIFFEQLYGYLLAELPGKKALDVFFVLEEASSMYIPLLPLALANLRKYRSGSIVCTQSPGQLKTLYGNAYQNIATNCQTKIFLSGQTDPEVLHLLETLGGKFVSTDDKGVDRVTHLISADAIRILPKNRTLIFASNHPVIKGRTSPFYRSLRYKWYAAIPPLPHKGDIPVQAIPLLLSDPDNPPKNENPEQEPV